MRHAIAKGLFRLHNYLLPLLPITEPAHSTLRTPNTKHMHSLPQDPLSLQTYTSGRWLRRKKLEREARLVNFSFNALCEKVIGLCPSANSIKEYEKIEGGYNKGFIFTIDNGSRIVAKLPTRVAGPPRLATHSEVATIKYLQLNTNIPVPNVLDWNDNPSNPIGSEYIIMEHALGVQLHQVWPHMTGPQQIACIRNISANIQQMAELEFPAYGSLYFADFPAIDKTYSLDPEFRIGPHCGTRYWDCNVGEARYYSFKGPNQGPWPDIKAYCCGLIDSGLSRLPPTNFDTKTPALSYQGSVAEHAQLLGSGRDVLNKLVEDSRIANTSAPTLLHPDIHKRNIFVSSDDPAIVTGIIDWQSTSIEPAFYYADESPDFATPIGEDQMAIICSQAFDACMKGLVHKISAARAVDENLLRVFRYCHRTWKEGAAAFRHELIELAKSWESLGISGPCPYTLPTEEELVIHEKQFKTFEQCVGLKQQLVELLGTTSDGWVPNDAWNETPEAHAEIFKHILQEFREAQDPSLSAEELKSMWPFDVPLLEESTGEKGGIDLEKGEIN